MCRHKKWTEGCWDCDRRFLSVKNYNHSREVVLGTKRYPRNGFYFGVELEVECKDCHPEDVLKKIKDSIDDTWEFKDDGSLANGLEFESQPLIVRQWTLEAKRLNWLKKIQKCCKSHDTTSCGLHIHVNRNGFSNDAHIGKVYYFINANQQALEVLGRRTWNNYCAASRPTYRSHDFDKYQALNLRNSETIEFRFFRGTLYIPTIRASIALASAICEIVPQMTQAEIEDDDSFIIFLIHLAVGKAKTNRKVFARYLVPYLRKKDFWNQELEDKFMEGLI